MKNENWKLSDPLGFGLGLVLTLCGLFFAFDAGYPRSIRLGTGPIPPEFKAQLVWLPIAILAYFGAIRFFSGRLQRSSFAIYAAVLIGVILAAVPHVQVIHNGAARWIGFSKFSIQPAEFAKVAVIVFLAAFLARYRERMDEQKGMKSRESDRDWAVRIASSAFVAGSLVLAILLIEREPDLGTASVIAVVGFLMWVMNGARFKAILIVLALAFVAGLLMVRAEPYRLTRLTHQADKWAIANIDDSEYQSIQSEVMMSYGGIRGTGLGNGRTKQVIPAPTTDFMMSTVAEEFGLIGTLSVLGFLAFLTFHLWERAQTAKTAFAKNVCIGVALWLTIQGCVNLLQANGTIPSIGIPFPFLSTGGSSLVALWLGLGFAQASLAPEAVSKKVAQYAVVNSGQGVENETDRNRRRHGRTRFSRT